MIFLVYSIVFVTSLFGCDRTCAETGGQSSRVAALSPTSALVCRYQLYGIPIAYQEEIIPDSRPKRKHDFE